MHPLAVHYWTWRGNMIISQSPDNKPATQYKAVKGYVTIVIPLLIAYLAGIGAAAYVTGQEKEYWDALREIVFGRRAQA